MGTKQIYRGYDVEYVDERRGWVISKDGELVSSQPSEDFALSFIDREIKKQREK